MRKQILLILILIICLQACAPGEVQGPSEPSAADPTEAAPEASPPPAIPAMALPDWINARPFLEAPTGQAGLAESGIPEGYQPQEIGYQTANLPSSGFEVQLTQITYEHPVDGQVNTNESVTIQVSSHQNQEAREEHLGLLVGSGKTWEYRQVSGYLTARFFSESGDGRIWISGPYLVAVWSGLDITAGDPALDPMVDIFAALYLELYPPE